MVSKQVYEGVEGEFAVVVNLSELMFLIFAELA